jgi:UDPglucose 6-dehydrogenase/GDP-mannose 6-dehydrogenase
MANVCTALGGVDIADVMRGVHLARYFTSTLDDGRRVKSGITSFLWAGLGYGGSCLPKDTKALSAHAAAHGQPMPMLDAVIATNLAQPTRIVTLLEKHLRDLGGKKVALLGLAFKADTDDMRESPAIALAKLLLGRGVKVVAYDPVARETARAALPAAVTHHESLVAAMHGVDAAVIVTSWDEFKDVPKLLNGGANPPVIIDGRRMLDPASVARYDGIGRGAPH